MGRVELNIPFITTWAQWNFAAGWYMGEDSNSSKVTVLASSNTADPTSGLFSCHRFQCIFVSLNQNKMFSFDNDNDNDNDRDFYSTGDTQNNNY